MILRFSWRCTAILHLCLSHIFLLFVTAALKVSLNVPSIVILDLCIAWLLLCFSVRFWELLLSFPGYFFTLNTPNECTFSYEDIFLTVNGKKLHGIFAPAKSEKYVYYFHGNGGPLPTFYQDIAYIHSLWFNVFSYDYPGYGNSSGIPNDTNLPAFSDAFYQKIVSDKNIDPKNIILWGYSIGTMIGIDFAHRNKNAYSKIVLRAPMSSRYDILREKIGVALQPYVLRKHIFHTTQTVSEISAPLLIMHGDQDTLLPIHHGEKIFKNSASEKKVFITLKDAPHRISSLHEYGTSLQNNIINFISGSPLPEKQILTKSP